MDLNRLLNAGFRSHGRGAAATQLDVDSANTTPSGGITRTTVVKGIIISVSAAPAAGVEFFIQGLTSGQVVWSGWIPAASIAPVVIPFFGGLRIDAPATPGERARLRIPSLGGAVQANGTLWYDYETGG